MNSALIASPDKTDLVLSFIKSTKLLPLLRDGHRVIVSWRKETRKESQSAHFHALISQIAAHVGGDLEDPEDAKRILISAFKHDTKDDPAFAEDWARFGDLRVGRGLRGETVLLGTQSKEFTVRLGAAFVEWLNAFGAECGARFKAPRSWEQWR